MERPFERLRGQAQTYGEKEEKRTIKMHSPESII